MIKPCKRQLTSSKTWLLVTAMIVGCGHDAARVQQQPIADSAIRFLMRHDAEGAVRIAPVTLMVSSSNSARQSNGAWHMKLDLAAVGPEQQIKRIAGSLVSGFGLDSAAYVELWPPEGSAIKLAPPVHERPGFELMHITFGDPWIETQRVDEMPIRAFTVGVAISAPPVEGTYRLRLRGEVIRQRLTSTEPSNIIVDDRIVEFVVKSGEVRQATAALNAEDGEPPQQLADCSALARRGMAVDPLR